MNQILLNLKALVTKRLTSYAVSSVTRVQNLNEAVCISLRANTLEKVYIAPLFMGKYLHRLGSFTLVYRSVLIKTRRGIGSTRLFLSKI